MDNSLKQKVRQAMKDNPGLPVKFIISILKAKQDELLNPDSIKLILQSEMDEISNLVDGVEVDE